MSREAGIQDRAGNRCQGHHRGGGDRDRQGGDWRLAVSGTKRGREERQQCDEKSWPRYAAAEGEVIAGVVAQVAEHHRGRDHCVGAAVLAPEHGESAQPGRNHGRYDQKTAIGHQ